MILRLDQLPTRELFQFSPLSPCWMNETLMGLVFSLGWYYYDNIYIYKQIATMNQEC